MRVLVTGGAGFIGANLVRRLVLEDWVSTVTVLDDMSTGSPENLSGADAEVVVGSVTDPVVVAGLVRRADCVIHLAAVPSVPRSLADPLGSHHANATGTLTLLEAARANGSPHVVVASSSSVYGANPTLPKHEGLRPEPLSPYAVSKLATESYALAYRACFGLDVLPFRFFNVFGPLQTAGHAYAAVIPTFLDAAVAGRPVVVHGDGRQTRDFTYVGSVCTVLADAARRRVSTEGPVNLAFGTRTSLLELLDQLADVLGGGPIDAQHVEPRAGDVQDSQADTTRLSSLFPDVRPTDLGSGLVETAAWFRSLSSRAV
jgi:UDP-glucose 4-epimerase